MLLLAKYTCSTEKFKPSPPYPEHWPSIGKNFKITLTNQFFGIFLFLFFIIMIIITFIFTHKEYMCENLTSKQDTKIVSNSLSYNTRNTYNISLKLFSVLLLQKIFIYNAIIW